MVTVVASVTKLIEMADVDGSTKAIKSFAAASPLYTVYVYVGFHVGSANTII